MDAWPSARVIATMKPSGTRTGWARKGASSPVCQNSCSVMAWLAGACASSSAGRASFGSACPWGRQTGRKPMPSSPVPDWSVKKGGLMTSRRLVRRKAVTGAVTGRLALSGRMCRRYLPGCRRCRSRRPVHRLAARFFLAAFGQPVRGTGLSGSPRWPAAPRPPARRPALAYDVQAAVPTADGPVFRWLLDGADETEWQPAGPSEAVRRLMDAYHVSQPTAMLAFL